MKSGKVRHLEEEERVTMEELKVSSHLALSTNNNCKSAIWLITIHSSDRSSSCLSRQKKKNKMGKKLALVDLDCHSPRVSLLRMFVQEHEVNLRIIISLWICCNPPLSHPLPPLPRCFVSSAALAGEPAERVIHLAENVLEKLRSTHVKY